MLDIDAYLEDCLEQAVNNDRRLQVIQVMQLKRIADYLQPKKQIQALSEPKSPLGCTYGPCDRCSFYDGGVVLDHCPSQLSPEILEIMGVLIDVEDEHE